MSTDPSSQARNAFWHLLTKHPLLSADDLANKDAGGTVFADYFSEARPEETARRLSIYSNGYVMRAVDVLEQEFEVTARLMGEDDFRECVWHYLRRHPSADANLRWVGRNFVQYLGTSAAQTRHPELRTPWLLDIARLEWSRSVAFDAAQREPLSFDDLQQIPASEWDRLMLSSVASLQRIETRFDLAALWHRVANGNEVSKEPAPQDRRSIAVWRRGNHVLHQQLEQAEEKALSLLESTCRLATFCEQLAQREQLDEQQVAQQALGYLFRWTDRGWLTWGAAE